MTEDEIEERSFRSLLPSEAHRRGTLEKKSRQHQGLEEDRANHDTTLGIANSFKVREQWTHIHKCKKTYWGSYITRITISVSLFPLLPCNPSLLTVSGWEHSLFLWPGQLFPVHHGHGASVHEGRGGEAAAPELPAASPSEGSKGKDKDGAGLAGTPEEEAERQGGGWQDATHQEEAEGPADETPAGAGT